MKVFLPIFLAQVVRYAVATLNFRAVAHGSLALTATTDFALSTLSFFVLARIVSLGDKAGAGAWAAYAFGSTTGSTVGLIIAKLVGT